MVKQPLKSGSLVFVLFLVFSFGTGIILVTASQQNTEGRSKAAPYAQPTLAPGLPCVIAADSNPNSCNHCQYGPGGEEAAFEGQQRNCAGAPTPGNAWDECMSWDPENNCVDTYRTYKAKRDADWRCKPLFSEYGLCDPAVEYPPGNP